MNDKQCFERLLQMGYDMGLTLGGIATKCGVPDATLRSAVDRDSVPKLETFLQVCDGLGIPPGNVFRQGPETELNPEEDKLIGLFRKIPSPELRAIVIRAAESVVEANNKKD